MFMDFQVKYPLFVSDFNETWSLTDFRKIKYKNIMNIRLVGPDCRSDIKLIVAFRNFANARKKLFILLAQCIYAFVLYSVQSICYIPIRH